MNECPLCRASAGAEGLVCAGCVANTLYYKQQAVAYKKVALRDAYEQAKMVLTAREPVFEEEQLLAGLVRKQGQLRDRLQETAEKVRDLRPTVARRKFVLDDRRRALEEAMGKLEDAADRHESRTVPVLEGLRWYRTQAQEAVHQRVWTRVLEHFVIFPIEADVPVAAKSKAQQQQPPFLVGVSTIAGLPLPNSGRYRDLGLPDEVCEAALYLVARLTWSLANTCHVTLPHPLFFPAGKPYAVIAEDVHRRTEFILSPSVYHHGRKGGGAGGGKTAPGRGGPRGGEGGGGVVARTPDGEAADPFHLGLEALQYNVHRLAISPEVGVDLAELWGKEALLLNLWALQQHAARLVQSYESVPDLPLPAIRPQDPHHAAYAEGGTRMVAYPPTPSQQQQHAQGVPPPTVVFEDQEEWSLVELKTRLQQRIGGAGGGGETPL